MYDLASAQLPEPPLGADRLFVTPASVIVLDGASAFAPESPAPGAYVDTLGRHLSKTLTKSPGADLISALAAGIEATASDLAVSPGCGPSSTVAIARWTADLVDILVLGDTQIITPHGVLRDDGLSGFAEAERTAYRARLRAGHGYDEQHQWLLSALQAEQLAYRNRPDGYWIAEADPTAATHALTASYSCAGTPWLTIETDGFYGPMSHLGLEAPTDATADDLQKLLRYCHRWEALADPDGALNPRAKRHDDKTVAVLRARTGV